MNKIKKFQKLFFCCLLSLSLSLISCGCSSNGNDEDFQGLWKMLELYDASTEDKEFYPMEYKEDCDENGSVDIIITENYFFLINDQSIRPYVSINSNEITSACDEPLWEGLNGVYYCPSLDTDYSISEDQKTLFTTDSDEPEEPSTFSINKKKLTITDPDGSYTIFIKVSSSEIKGANEWCGE